MADSTVPDATPGSSSPVRRLPLPASQPPYDDERRSPSWPSGPEADGALALSPVPDRAGHGISRPALRLMDAADESAGRPRAVSPFRATSPDRLPDPRRWAAKLAQAAVEALHGQRPAQQLTRWTDEAVHHSLTRRAKARRTPSVVRPRVRAVRVCLVSRTIAEAAAVVQVGPLIEAVAVRLEATGDHWVCTEFDLIEPARPRPVSR